jgi:ribosome-associated translation inhibitor RaiA
MQITLNDGNIRTSPAMLEFVQSQAGAAFRALGDRIHSVTVSISDLNGPKRGVDKACRVSAGVAGFGVISVRAVGPDFYGAIRDAIRKAARAASHRVRRSH